MIAFAGNPIDFVLQDFEINLVDRFHHLLGPENVEHVEGFQLFRAKYRLVHSSFTAPRLVGSVFWDPGIR